MISNSFYQIIRASWLALILGFSVISHIDEAGANEANANVSDYPVISMKFLFVDELSVCKPYGYPGCYELGYEVDNVAGLESNEKILKYTRRNIPAGDTVSLGIKFREKLNNYTKFILNNPYTQAGERNSVLVLFDFGDLVRASDLNVKLSWRQESTEILCRGYTLPVKSGSIGYTVPENYKYWMYHTSAEVFNPCSNVVWTLEVTHVKTGKPYKPWKFRTTSKESQ